MRGTPKSGFENYARRRAQIGGIALLDDYNPYFQPIDRVSSGGAPEPDTPVSFAHYDYLGLARHPVVQDAAIDAIKTFGPGVGASRLVGGERSFHRDFETDLANFLGQPAAITLVSGYLTNLTLLNHVAGRSDLVIADELAHNSIMSAVYTRPPGTGLTFRHNDLDHLEALLRTHRANHRNVFVAVESLYSMDGDVVDLPRLLEIKSRYSAFLVLDEAHAIGVLGSTGRGAAEHFGVDPSRIEIVTGTLSKTFVSAGGFVATNETAIEWLRYSLPGFVFSVGIPPSILASAHAALRLLRAEPERVNRLISISRYFLDLARQRGLDVGNAAGLGIVPILFASPEETISVADFLTRAGIYAPPIIYVGVPREAPRIRFFLTAEHNEALIGRTIDLIVEARARFAEHAGVSEPLKSQASLAEPGAG